jgi:hypothetical protein
MVVVEFGIDVVVEDVVELLVDVVDVVLASFFTDSERAKWSSSLSLLKYHLPPCLKIFPSLTTWSPR